MRDKAHCSETRDPIKILIAGVGGQGVVFLTDLLLEAALFLGISVATSEIRGLTQRGGTVVAALTIGEKCTGFIQRAGADYLVGLEIFEALRCLPYLHRGSRAVVDSTCISPFSLQSSREPGPDTGSMLKHLRSEIKELAYLEDQVNEVSISRNLYVLGRATNLEDFPLPSESIESVMKSFSKSEHLERNLGAFRMGCKG